MAIKQFLGGRVVLGTEFVGYKYRIFEAGTSTPKTTYKDSGLTAGNENADPIVLGSYGDAQIWFDGNAKAVWYTPADVVIHTDDNVNLASTATATGSANLVLNESFEDDSDADGNPDSWTKTLYSAGTFSLDTSTQFNGSKSVKFTSTSTGGGYITSTSNYAVSPSVVYSVGFALKSSAADVRNVVEILWYQDDGSASSTASTTVYDDSTTNPTSWSEKWVEATSPSDAAFAKIRLTGCHSSDATSGSTWFDDIKFTRFAVKKFHGIHPFVFNARLTLTSGTALTTGDVTAAETIYLTPFRGNRISLYTSAGWVEYPLTEISADVPDAAQMNDVFVYDNNGALTLDVVAWTNDTTRATALALQDGIYVKTGALGRRYAGSFYSNTTGNGQTEDSLANRYVWNYYNRVPRPMVRKESENTWDYTTATFRQAFANTANQLNFIIGVSEDEVTASVLSSARNGSGNVVWTVAVGLDSTSAVATNCVMHPGESAAANVLFGTKSEWRGFPGIGKHYLAWLEFSAATGTTTWIGDGGATYLQSGMNGVVMG